MDDGDFAREYSDFHLKVAIMNARATTVSAASSMFCEDCGEEIPEERRNKMPGCTRCVECQTEFERIGGN